jgi:hypothetical protein
MRTDMAKIKDVFFKRLVANTPKNGSESWQLDK